MLLEAGVLRLAAGQETIISENPVSACFPLWRSWTGVVTNWHVVLNTTCSV